MIAKRVQEDLRSPSNWSRRPFFAWAYIRVATRDEKKREIFIGALHCVKHVDQRGRLLRFIPCVAGQVDGCLQARKQVVRVTEAGIEDQKANFIKTALVFRFPKRMMKIRRGIGNRLARQFPDTSSIFNHYLTFS